MMRRVVLGLSCILILAVLSAGCGRSSQLLAPVEGATASNIAVGLAPDEAATASGLDVSDEVSRNGTPISGPTRITQPGNYRLSGDIDVAEGDAIVITASHVRLWLGEHRLSGPGNKVGRALVIDGAEDVAVRGGRIERFGIGAVLMNATGCRLRGVAVRGGDETADPANGNPPQIGIMLINSARNHIGGNRLLDVNLGVFVRGGSSHDNLIYGNTVVAGAHGLLAICYNPAPGTDPTGPTKDLVKSNYLARFGTGISASEQSAQNVFAMNSIRYFNSAYSDKNGTNVFVRNQTIQITP